MFVPKFRLKCLSVAIAAIVLPQSTNVFAQDIVLEEIIVTAQVRTESLQDVPLSVNAVSGQKMMEAGIDKIEDLHAYVPNFTMSETGIGTNIYIRGIGSGINQGFEQSVGMYVDGVYYGRAQLARAPFLDLERVEVLRGPQSILFGKNSIAGALNITTAKPTQEFEGMVSATYEPDHNEQVYDAMVSGGLTDTLAGRLAYRNRSMDGYVDNLTNNNDEPNRDEETIRGSLLWDATDDLAVNLKAEHSSFNIKGRQVEIFNETSFAGEPFYADQLASVAAPDVIPGLSNTVLDGKRSANKDSSDNDMDSVTLRFDYQMGDYSLTAISAYLTYNYDELCDCDFTGADLFSVRSREDYEQWSQEIRLVSPAGKTFEYIVGAYYQSNDLNFKDRFITPVDGLLVDSVALIQPAIVAQAVNNLQAPRNFDQDSDLYSVFAQGTYNITDSLRLTLGARYNYEDKSGSRDLVFVNGTTQVPVDAFDQSVIRALFIAENHSLSDSRNEDNISPLAILEWTVNDDVMTYISATQGYKSGGYDARSNLSTTPSTSLLGTTAVGSFDYEDEKATSYEIGAKTTLFDGRGELNVAAFFTKYEDLQVSIFDGTLGFNVGNAGKAETKGVEVDGRFKVTEHFTLIGSAAYLDFEFTDYPNGQCTQAQRLSYTGNGVCQSDFDGKSNQYVSEWSGTLTGDYRRPLGDALMFTAILDVIYTGEYSPTQNLDPAIDQDDYTKVNARLGIGGIDGDWDLALIGRNLTDQTIVTYANDTPLAASAIFNTISYYGFVERERSIAIQGTYRF